MKRLEIELRQSISTLLSILSFVCNLSSVSLKISGISAVVNSRFLPVLGWVKPRVLAWRNCHVLFRNLRGPWATTSDWMANISHMNTDLVGTSCFPVATLANYNTPKRSKAKTSHCWLPFSDPACFLRSFSLRPIRFLPRSLGGCREQSPSIYGGASCREFLREC